MGARGGTWGGPSAPPEKLPWDVEGAGKCGDERREGAERCWRCRAGAGEQGEGGDTPAGWDARRWVWGRFTPKSSQEALASLVRCR